jgi:hypothetical protein
LPTRCGASRSPHLQKDALKRAHESSYPFEVAKLMSAQGLMGITIPKPTAASAAR